MSSKGSVAQKSIRAGDSCACEHCTPEAELLSELFRTKRSLAGF